MTERIGETDERFLEGDFESLARALAHELRNPLNAMRLNLGLLREDLLSLRAGEETLEIADSLTREVEQLSQITTAFRDYTRRLRPRIEEVDLAGLCGELAGFLRPQLETAGVGLRTELGPITVSADRTLLRQAVLNLLLNALESGGGTVWLSCGVEADGRVHVTVVDDGPGFDGEPESCLAPFVSTKDEGTGIGLPLTMKIARVHGGELRLRNPATGGAEASLLLPAAPAIAR